MKTRNLLLGVVATALVACGSSESPQAASAAPDAAVSANPAPTSTEDEYERLKAVTPVSACALLTADQLRAVFPEQDFAIHEQLDPRLSGYVWDSRCVSWAGVGTIDVAKDTPTHSVGIYVATSASEAKAEANLASRQESAATTAGYRAQPTLGAHAYATVATGSASLYFVRGQSEIRIDVSELGTPNEQEIAKAIALAQSL